MCCNSIRKLVTLSITGKKQVILSKFFPKLALVFNKFSLGVFASRYLCKFPCALFLVWMPKLPLKNFAQYLGSICSFLSSQGVAAVPGDHAGTLRVSSTHILCWSRKGSPFETPCSFSRGFPTWRVHPPSLSVPGATCRSGTRNPLGICVRLKLSRSETPSVTRTRTPKTANPGDYGGRATVSAVWVFVARTLAGPWEKTGSASPPETKRHVGV